MCKLSVLSPNEGFLSTVVFTQQPVLSRDCEATSAALTLPTRFADGLDVNVHGYVLLGSLLATVERRHRDWVALLLLVAQTLCVPDVT